MLTRSEDPLDEFHLAEVSSRTSIGHRARIILNDGTKIETRRFTPLGKGDCVRVHNGTLSVLARRDDDWIDLTHTWSKHITSSIFGEETVVTFKEIESAEELNYFYILQALHYRGAGGAGRTVPLIAQCNIWDLPTVLGFIELSSSMIANSARKRFLDYPYREDSTFLWKKWDRATAREYSNLVCRISRFVIHPEIRGLGLAKLFTDAAKHYVKDRWHFGGFRPRFLEITADMLRYYTFLDSNFLFVGETEGNEHRLQKDMRYLARRALGRNGRKGMPQGGGGIMTLQRGYASALLEYTEANDKTLPDVIHSLRFEASSLDQQTWEALYKLNRRPKPCYIAPLTEDSADFVKTRSEVFRHKSPLPSLASNRTSSRWDAENITIGVSAVISQTEDARRLQDSFGFVGSKLEVVILRETSFSLRPSEVLLICGASGSGKSLLLNCLPYLAQSETANATKSDSQTSVVRFSGRFTPDARMTMLGSLPTGVTPLDLKGRVPLDEFMSITAQMGLAEPQLFVRPTETLSSGQKYRLQIALSVLEQPDLLVIDNFCENLDRFTIWAVCKGIKRLASRYKMGVVVATASYERIRRPLEASRLLLLRRGEAATVVEELEPDSQ